MNINTKDIDNDCDDNGTNGNDNDSKVHNAAQVLNVCSSSLVLPELLILSRQVQTFDVHCCSAGYDPVTNMTSALYVPCELYQKC